MSMYLQEKLIKNKLGLLNLAGELRNVSKACKIMGYSRDTFYRYQQIVEQDGAEALVEKSRRKPNLENRVAADIEQAVIKMALLHPEMGHRRVHGELLIEGISLCAASVHNIWKRNGLSTLQARLKKLEEWAAKEGIVLTEEQKIALEKKKEEERAYGEIETEHPGYLGSQDTFYIGYLKGVGKIYQQTFVDTYSKVAICKLYTTKNAVTAADLLNDRVLPFFESYHAPLLRVLTDRGSEYCGNMDEHPYQLFIALSNIEHSRTKAYSPQTNGICERFHRTVLNEFYRIAFRSKVYESIATLQSDLDEWLDYFNEQRPHTGKICCGRTPMQTFKEGLAELEQKRQMINLA